LVARFREWFLWKYHYSDMSLVTLSSLFNTFFVSASNLSSSHQESTQIVLLADEFVAVGCNSNSGCETNKTSADQQGNRHLVDPNEQDSPHQGLVSYSRSQLTYIVPGGHQSTPGHSDFRGWQDHTQTPVTSLSRLSQVVLSILCGAALLVGSRQPEQQRLSLPSLSAWKKTESCTPASGV